MVEINDPGQIEFLRTWLRPYRYAYFGEGSGYALTPVKFAAPPFCPTNTDPLVMSSLFEDIIAPVTNAPLDVVDGWTVLTNPVEVVLAPAAPSGTNYLRLSQAGVWNPAGVADRRGAALPAAL